MGSHYPYIWKDWAYVKIDMPNNLKQADGTSCGAFACLYCAGLIRHGRDVLTDRGLLELPIDKIECGRLYAEQLHGYIFCLIMQMGQTYEVRLGRRSRYVVYGLLKLLYKMTIVLISVFDTTSSSSSSFFKKKR